MQEHDQAQRLQALEPFQSFAVSAPAGSGKTELLAQRVLRLLGIVENPEEIVCMTFANKAADEMKSRVMEYLVKASANISKKNSSNIKNHEALAINLAKKALNRNKEKGWDLLDNPSRLRIYTIDGFCRKLTGQLPLESGFNPHTKDLLEPTISVLGGAEPGKHSHRPQLRSVHRRMRATGIRVLAGKLTVVGSVDRIERNP